jgi:hypothetical protein
MMVSNVFLSNLLPTMSNEAIGAIKIGGQTTKPDANAKASDSINSKIVISNDEKMSRSMTWEELDAGSIISKSRRGRYPNGPKIVPIHLPLPIFVMNMPKSGSTTIHNYFNCGMGRHFSVHNLYNKEDMEESRLASVNADMEFVATCMGHNVFHDRPVAEGCGGYSVYTDSGGIIRDLEGEDGLVLDWNSNLIEAAKKNGTTNGTLAARTRKEQKKELHKEWCFYPGVHALDNIAKYYPYATILHLPRNATNWAKSTVGWGGNMGRSRLIERYNLVCDGFKNTTLTGPPKHPGMYHRRHKREKGHHKTNLEWIEWYEQNYTSRIREFASNHPTLTYFESPLEDPITPKKLEEATGFATSCYGHSLKSVDRDATKEKMKKKKKAEWEASKKLATKED